MMHILPVSMLGEIFPLLSFCPVFDCLYPWPGSPAVFHLAPDPKRHIAVGWPVECQLACTACETRMSSFPLSGETRR